MGMTKNMLKVLMDGIKDTNMMMDYAEMAMDADMTDVASWFKSKAKKRMDSLESDYDYVCDRMNLREKVKSGDEIAEALKTHLEDQIDMLKNRYSAI